MICFIVIMYKYRLYLNADENKSQDRPFTFAIKCRYSIRIVRIGSFFEITGMW